MSAPFTPGLPPAGSSSAFIGRDAQGNLYLLRWHETNGWEALGWVGAGKAAMPALRHPAGQDQGLIVGHARALTNAPAPVQTASVEAVRDASRSLFRAFAAGVGYRDVSDKKLTREQADRWIKDSVADFEATLDRLASLTAPTQGDGTEPVVWRSVLTDILAVLNRYGHEIGDGDIPASHRALMWRADQLLKDPSLPGEDEPKLQEHERDMMLGLFSQRAKIADKDKRALDATVFRMGIDVLAGATPSSPVSSPSPAGEPIGWLDETDLPVLARIKGQTGACRITAIKAHAGPGYVPVSIAKPSPAGGVREALEEAIEFAEQDIHALTPAGEAMVKRWRAALSSPATGEVVEALRDYPARIWVERDEETNEKRWFSIAGAGVEYVRAGVSPLSKAAADVLAERSRQIEVEGWTPAHDDAHTDGEMADAAALYASLRVRHITGFATWPWDAKWWKPKDRRRDLVRAGALIVAEIERLDRKIDAALNPAPGHGEGGQ